jgi:hypothetical protein
VVTSGLDTVWATDFETQAGSSIFYLFSFSLAALAETNNK